MALFITLPVALISYPADGVAATEKKYNKWKARKLVSRSTCFKCHSVKRKKVGPAYLGVAKKYKGDPEAEAKIYKHITSKPTVKIKGKKKTHPRVRTENEKEIMNVVYWVLSTNKRK